MSTPIVPPEYSAKIERLRIYFQAKMPELVVRGGWDFDTRSASFPFDDGPKLKHLLRVSVEVLQDFSEEKIVQRLEQEEWEQVLMRAAPDQMAIFTSKGFKFRKRPD